MKVHQILVAAVTVTVLLSGCGKSAPTEAEAKATVTEAKEKQAKQLGNVMSGIETTHVRTIKEIEDQRARDDAEKKKGQKK